MELAYSMASLALYDIIIYADDSGSMAFEEGGERIQDLKLMVGRVADVATLFDDDGILVRFMNGTTEGNGIRDSGSASQMISQASPFCSPEASSDQTMPACLLAACLLTACLLAAAACCLLAWGRFDQSGKSAHSPTHLLIRLLLVDQLASLSEL